MFCFAAGPGQVGRMIWERKMDMDPHASPERLDKMTIARLGEESNRLSQLASRTADDAKRQSLFSKSQQCCDEIIARRKLRRK